ncbi:MAG: tRNA preQ1(34) S-adenosylmethionine ribosyltransferase-isomerase QueA [Clostridia bacterium]|nr:tRNA preQ1(34) S-adenosylmethionine ribosyltransferase-isomerase QueA [Clostridia bacterium]
MLPETSETKSDYDYPLPESLIAQSPIEPRDASRLMVLNRNDGSVEHRVFRDVIDYLNPGDVLVLNETRVLPARLIGRRIYRMDASGTRVPSEGSAPVELLLLKQLSVQTWEALAGPGKRARTGDILSFGEGILTAEIGEIGEGGSRRVTFTPDGKQCSTVLEAIHLLGTMPLPPYIRQKLENQERYQTVYSKTEGSAAAPTAGLHFTLPLLERIRKKGVFVVPILLHVGLGTFRPVKEERIRDHEMHSEFIEISPEAASLINERKKAGSAIVAVGTTSVRTLESASDEDGTVHPVRDETGIFIYPGYRFKVVDHLITNFHLPESTLLMLVSAFSSREMILNAYRIAVENKYRFFSFGDAMMIL